VAADAHAPVAVHGQGHDVEHAHGGHGDGTVLHQFDDIVQQRECYSLGMWLFLATEVMMFGGLFFAYTFYRWKFEAAFHEGSSHLFQFWGTLNTFVLLASSWTMAMAVYASMKGNRRALMGFLTITWLFGAAFIGIKAIEWGIDWYEGLIPGLNWTFYDPAAGHHQAENAAKLAAKNIPVYQVQMYFVIYFCMTGLHAIHMIVGLALVGYFIFLASRGVFLHRVKSPGDTPKPNDQPVELLGLYWHLVDIVWVFLFPLLYLIAGFNLFKQGLALFPGGGGH
jgi:cytochrome c oxidase subunit III